MTRARLDKNPGDVAAMFDSIAGRYDLLNDVLSLGQDRYWRRVVARAAAAAPGEVILDLAAGTGTSSASFTGTGARCVACDFSLGMLRTGASRLAGSAGAAGAPRPAGGAGAARAAGPVRFVAGDGLALPFASGSFDAVTISFGLRNMADPGGGLAELRRVAKPGGRLVVCEFSHLHPPVLDALYGRYLAAALPAIARRVTGQGAAYSYLAESIAAWPA